jgi:hypothetical protein
MRILWHRTCVPFLYMTQDGCLTVGKSDCEFVCVSICRHGIIQCLPSLNYMREMQFAGTSTLCGYRQTDSYKREQRCVHISTLLNGD